MVTQQITDEKSKCCHTHRAGIVNNRLLWLLVIVIIGAGADQLSKRWAQETLARASEYTSFESGEEAVPQISVRYLPEKDIVLIPNTFQLTYRENRAAGFSLASSLPEWFRRPLLISVSIFASIFFLVWYFRIREKDGLLLVSLCLVMSGAIGNLLDRVRFGYVVDFFDFYLGFIGYGHLHWPTFNIADSLIVAGAIGIAIRSIWPKHVADEEHK